MFESPQKLRLSGSYIVQSSDNALHIHEAESVELELHFRPESENLDAIKDEFDGELKKWLIERVATLLPKGAECTNGVQWRNLNGSVEGPSDQLAFRICLANDLANPKTVHCLVGIDFAVNQSDPGPRMQVIVEELAPILNGWFSDWRLRRST